MPTFVYYSEDDPIINKSCIGFENARSNDNILIASNKHGSHLCNFEHFFTVEQYLPKPAFEFFDYFLNTKVHLPSDNIQRRNKDKPTIPIIIEDDSKIETQSHLCLTMASSKIESIDSKSNKSCDYDERLYFSNSRLERKKVVWKHIKFKPKIKKQKVMSFIY